MKLARALIGMILVARVLVAQGEEPTLEVNIQPGEILVGDLVRIELRVTAGRGIEPRFPFWGETWGEAEVRHVGSVEVEPLEHPRRRFRQLLTIALFDTGEITLPNPDITYTADHGERRLEPSRPITVMVTSLLDPQDGSLEPRPAAPPRALPWGKSFLRTTVVMLLLTLAAAAALLRMRLSRAAAMPREVDPLAALQAQLDDLRGNENPAAVLAALSLSLRRFFGLALAFPAAESTTTELRRRLLERQLPRSLVQRAESLLRQSDGVKFARRPATPDVAETGLAEAGAIAAATVGFLHPPDEPEEGQHE